MTNGKVQVENDAEISAKIEDEKEGFMEEQIRFCCCKLHRHNVFLILIVLLVIVLNSDQNIMSPVLTPVAREFGFVERDEDGNVLFEFDESLNKTVEKVDANERDFYLGGLLTIATFGVGGVAALFIGYLTDTVNRRNTLALVLVIGETSCVMTIFVQGYWALFITRAITGISIGGASPLTFSLIGDLFSAKWRGKAVAAVGSAIGIGSGLGQVAAGIIAGPDGSNWRFTFVAVGVPAYFVAAALLYFVEEPARGQKEEVLMDAANNNSKMADADDVPYDGKITWSKVKILVGTPTVLLVLLQGIPGSLPWGIFGGFLSDFLAEEKQVERAVTGTVLLIFGIGLSVGTVMAGVLVDYLWVRRKRLIPLVLMFTTVMGTVPMWFFVDIPVPVSFFTIAACVIPAGFFLGWAGNSTKTLMMNCCVPEVRGAAFALLTLTDDLGRSLGVFLISLFFQAFEPEKDEDGQIVKTGRSFGIQYGFLVGWGLCGLTIGLIYFWLDRDYERCQDRVADAASKDKQPKDDLVESL